MKVNIYSWLSGFTLSGTAMITGWIQVETLVEVAVYGFIGGVVGMLGKWFIQYIRTIFLKYFYGKP